MKKVLDYDPNNPMKNLEQIGFQATHLSRAVEIIKEMKKENAKIFFGFTANMMASGLRGLFTDMAKRKLIDVVVTTGGSIDHDLIRSYSDYYIGSFDLDDKELHKKGINRIGNILVPNKCYEILEQKINPIFEKLYKKNKTISPSELIKEIGNSINSKNSFLYWCSKNNIPVFSPGITDSAIGLQTYFFKQRHVDFSIDVTKDMKELASITLNADKTGAIILGGGITKHHIIGVNILREGLDYSVYISTSSQYDGSLSGARTKEAISWGKLKEKSTSITVEGDASIVFPIIYNQLF
ncbi:MAG: deoxyhypusine synthase [Candidatus ainarchaeum sp.]|nr:deoxyhypusine synthase [Candidatus ainarchaeum sp.]